MKKSIICLILTTLFLFLINGCNSTTGPTAPKNIPNDIVEPLLQKSTSKVFPLNSGVFEVEAVLSPPAPSPVTVGSPISASVDFGMSFSSIDQICFIFQFQNDLLDPGEWLNYGPIGNNIFGFMNVGPNPQSARTSCLVKGSHCQAIALFLDGQQNFGIQMATGSVIIGSLKIQITGETIFPFAAFNIKGARVKLGDSTSSDQFGVIGRFILSTSSDGLDVLNEEVVVIFDGFSESIPAGSFVREEERFRFIGAPGGITLMEISDGGQFKVRAEGLDLSGLDPNNPIPFSLQIGNDIGETEIQVNTDR